MKILIISEIFWPEYNDFKNKALASALIKDGHEVFVAAPYPNYPLGRIFDNYKMRLFKFEKIDGIKVIRLPIYPDHSKNGFKRIARYLSFSFAVLVIGGILTPKVDVIFVDSPPMTIGVVGVLLKIIKRSRLVLDVGDLWPEAIAQSGMVRGKLVNRFASILAKFSYKHADSISTLTQGFAKRIATVSGRNDINIIAPWADANLFYPTQCSNEFIEKYKLKDKFIIMHAGNIGPFQNLEHILLAAETLIDEDIVFLFVGSGSDSSRLINLAESNKITNVFFPGHYPNEQMAGILACASVLLVSLYDSDYLNINIPSKLPAYMACGKPILAVCNGEVAEIVKKYSVGIVSYADSPFVLAQKILKMKNNDMELLQQMGSNSLKAYEANFSIDTNLRKYCDLINLVAK